ncbi:PorV/PorQ family protein [Bacteroidota bacterium]
MSNKYLAITIIIIFSHLFLVSQSSAQSVSKTGTTAANFLEIAVGASAVGMGGAYVSVADDAATLYWNVGGLANLEQNEAILVHTNWIAETSFDYAGLAIPLGEFGTIGLSFTSLSMDDMKVRTVEKPDGTGEFFSAGDIAFGLSYSRKLTDRFSIGLTVKYIQQNIWHMSSSAVAFDAGTVFKTDLLGGMVIGASITNFGTAMKLDGRDARQFVRIDDNKLGSNDQIPTNIELDEWELPLSIQLGVSTQPIKTENYSLTVAVDAVHPNNNFESINFGTELGFMDFLFIRGGYQSLFLEDAEGGLSFGIGLNSKMLFSQALINFDYAFRDFGRLDNIHSFSIGVKF